MDKPIERPQARALSGEQDDIFGARKKHEWIHDASCAECGAEARRHVFPAHELEPLEGGLIDKFGVFWPTCRRCGRCHGPLLAVLEEPKP